MSKKLSYTQSSLHTKVDSAKLLQEIFYVSGIHKVHTTDIKFRFILVRTAVHGKTCW